MYFLFQELVTGENTINNSIFRGKERKKRLSSFPPGRYSRKFIFSDKRRSKNYQTNRFIY
jgi:hypothetical protein